MELDELKTYLLRGAVLLVFSVIYSILLSIVGFGAFFLSANVDALKSLSLVMIIVMVGSLVVYGWAITEIVRRVR